MVSFVIFAPTIGVTTLLLTTIQCANVVGLSCFEIIESPACNASEKKLPAVETT